MKRKEQLKGGRRRVRVARNEGFPGGKGQRFGKFPRTVSTQLYIEHLLQQADGKWLICCMHKNWHYGRSPSTECFRCLDKYGVSWRLLLPLPPTSSDPLPTTAVPTVAAAAPLAATPSPLLSTCIHPSQAGVPSLGLLVLRPGSRDGVGPSNDPPSPTGLYCCCCCVLTPPCPCRMDGSASPMPSSIAITSSTS